MKRILLVIIFFTITFNLSAQLITDSVQGINCYNDTGFIALDVNNTTLIQWKYKNPAGIWEPIANFPEMYQNTIGDTLWTTRCGKYAVEVFFSAPPSILKDFFIPCPLTIGQGQENILCYGDSSGILKRSTTFGGIPFDIDSSYIYTWYYADDSLGTNSFVFPDTTETLDSLFSGWYKTIVTDAIGCTDSTDYSPFCINFPAAIKVDTQIVHNKCIGDATASIFLTVSGGIKYSIGNNYFYYLILNNDTVAFSDLTGSTVNFEHFSINPNDQNSIEDSIKFKNLATGSYVFSVVDSNGCTTPDDQIIIEILEPDAYTVYTSSQPDTLICASDTGVFAIDNITGGNQPLNYYYFVGFNDTTINVPGGTYNILVEDSLGCTNILPATYASQHEIKVESSIEHILCFGDSSGIITIDSIYGGNTPYTTQWGGVNHQALSAGVYTVFFTDDVGCTLIKDFTVEQSDPFSVSAIFYLPSCNGFSDGSIKINGVGDLNPIWLNGTGTVDSLYGLTAGIYSVVVSDSLSCVDTISLTLNEPEQIAFTFTNYDSTLLCRGAETTIDIAISGGTGPFSIEWDDSSTDLQRVLSAGIYSCFVTDTNGCFTPYDQITIFEPDTFISSSASNNATCKPDIPGDAIINTFGGTNPIQYIWSTGDTTPSINSLWEVHYWVIATDSCGNSISDTFDLIPYDLIMALIYDSIAHIGSITIDSIYGGPFSYEWIDSLGNIISTDSVTPLCEGTYYVTATNNTSNCSVTDTLYVPPYYLPTQLPFSIMDTITTTVLDTADLWGAAPYIYLWSDSSGLPHADLCPGPNWVEITDTFGCVVRADFDITPYYHDTLLPYKIIDTSTSTTKVFLDSLWGAGPYTYLWSDSSTSDTANLCPVSNWLEVTDIFGCVVRADFDIAPYLDSIIDISTTTVLHPDSLWGASSYSYLWSDSSGLPHADLCPGSHWVEVTDNFGCVVRADFVIADLEIDFDPVETIIVDGESTIVECDLNILDIDLLAIAKGGTGDDYTYEWSGGSTKNPLNIRLNPGNHSVTVIDYNACTKELAFTIVVMSAECVPNVFTPNGDNINDTWNLDNIFLFEDSEVLIYGRFGKQLFQSIGYDNNWDGTNKKGNDLPAGVYFYSIEIGHEVEPIKGTVTILK